MGIRSMIGVYTAAAVCLASAAHADLKISPHAVAGGASAQAVFSVEKAVPSDTAVTLAVKSGQVAFQSFSPASVSIPTGAKSVAFTVNTSVVAADTDLRITATAGKKAGSGDLRVLAPSPIGVSFSPPVVVDGGSSTGTVTLSSAPVAAVTVNLKTTADANEISSLPATVVVPAGSLTATFAVTAGSTARPAEVRFVAGTNGRGAAGVLGVAGKGYAVSGLVANTAAAGAASTDPNLVNPFGIAMTDDALWLADNGASLATSYGANGTVLAGVVSIPGPGSSASMPTAEVANDTHGFEVTQNGHTEPAHLLIATANGTIAGWNAKVSAGSAITVVDNSAAGSSYTGLALAKTPLGNYLLAVDAGKNAVDVFDKKFTQVATISTSGAPAGLAPFGISMLDHNTFAVTFAVPAASGSGVTAGPGLGAVAAFTLSGHPTAQVEAGPALNAPVSVAIAPEHWGVFSNALLVANHGSGTISAFSMETGQYLGDILDSTGASITIDGLWGISIGAHGALYFTAGPNGGADGLFGAITPAN